MDIEVGGSMEDKTVLKTINLGKYYGNKSIKHKVLEDINIDIKKGEFVAIMGKSGAGKSTLLNLLSTIDYPSGGNIYIEGKDVSNMDERQIGRFRRDKLGFIFQDYNLLDQMNVYDNITLPMSLNNIGKQEQEERVCHIAGLFGIEKLLDKYPSTLSGGEKQRVAAARAIIMKPSIVMADEPTGALDSKSSEVVMECLRKMNKEEKVTIIMVTHDDFAASYSDRIINIKDGKIV